MYKLAPSILSADFANLGHDVIEVEKAGVEYLHIDVMDGSFVPSISFGAPIVRSIRPISNLIFDVHFMVEEPMRFVDEFAEAGADIITVQAETCTHLHRTIAAIKDRGVKVGVSLNPATPLGMLKYVIDDLDMVLIMSVNPGYGGQTFIPFSLEKIKELRELIDSRNLDTDIEVDGGISPANATQVIDAGANILVAGSAIFNGNISENVQGFNKVLKGYRKE